jgi:hypothetical protein
VNTLDLPLTVAWFSAAKVDGPAIGDPETTTWGNFAGVLTWYRREDDAKDGCNFVAARFTLEADGRHVRRLKRNLLARTAVAMDCETNKKTGEVPGRVSVRPDGQASFTRRTTTPRPPRATGSCCRCRKRSTTSCPQSKWLRITWGSPACWTGAKSAPRHCSICHPARLGRSTNTTSPFSMASQSRLPGSAKPLERSRPSGRPSRTG